MLYDPKWEVTAPPPVLQPWQTILLDAADLIERKGWTQDAFSRCCHPNEEPVSYCAVGAMLAVSRLDECLDPRDHDFVMAREKLALAVSNNKRRSSATIFCWNDAREQTPENVITTMRDVALAVPPTLWTRIKRRIANAL